MTYATASDVGVRWARIPTPEESALIDVRLADVERIIRKRIPDLDALVAAGTIDADDVVQVESDVVLRLIRDTLGGLSPSAISDRSHEEAAWKETPPKAVIDYEHARALSIALPAAS